MGDNVYLGDRNGVRTPMQWNPDRNAGFSRANPAMLYSPVIMDPVWGYQALNVEAQQSDPSSLLNWMRNMIALRKLFRVFGRGTLEFLAPANRKILAYVRRFDGEQILCVTNLSRYAQPVDLDLSEFAGMTPVEMLGYVEFPTITRDAYRLTLGPYGFFWLELQGTAEPAATRDTRKVALTAPTTEQGWAGLIRELENSILPEFLTKQPWFAAKGASLQSTRVIDWGELGGAALLLIEANLEESDSEIFLVPLLMKGDRVDDALSDERFCQALLDVKDVPTRNGRIIAQLPALPAELPAQVQSIGKSHSTIIYGDQFVLKFFRRQQPGIEPDVEISRFLTEQAQFKHTPRFLGYLEYQPKSAERSIIATVRSYIENVGDGWSWIADELERYFENSATSEFPQNEDAARDHVGSHLEAAAVLGVRTAELHLALASSSTDPAFTAEQMTRQDIEELAVRVRDSALQGFELLKKRLSLLPDDSLQMAGQVLMKRREIVEPLLTFSMEREYGKRIRVHGNFHLGRVLRTRNDFVIADFDGEAELPLMERRAKRSPLKDVACMLRSFSYAAHSALISYVSRRPEDMGTLEPWARLWERSVCSEFVSAYARTASPGAILPPQQDDLRRLLNLLLLEKATDEMVVELHHNPARARIPLAGILALVT
jgi:maltose alpha-D-glucosyltransferase/alpha-amylase